VSSVRDDLIRMTRDLIVAHTSVDQRLIKAHGLLLEGMSANANLEISRARDELAAIGQRFEALLEHIDVNVPTNLRPLEA